MGECVLGVVAAAALVVGIALPAAAIDSGGSTLVATGPATSAVIGASISASAVKKTKKPSSKEVRAFVATLDELGNKAAQKINPKFSTEVQNSPYSQDWGHFKESKKKPWFVQIDSGRNSVYFGYANLTKKNRETVQAYRKAVVKQFKKFGLKKVGSSGRSKSWNTGLLVHAYTGKGYACQISDSLDRLNKEVSVKLACTTTAKVKAATKKAKAFEKALNKAYFQEVTTAKVSFTLPKDVIQASKSKKYHKYKRAMVEINNVSSWMVQPFYFAKAPGKSWQLMFWSASGPADTCEQFERDWITLGPKAPKWNKTGSRAWAGEKCLRGKSGKASKVKAR